VNIAAVNKGVNISFQHTGFMPFGYILSSGVSGSYGISISNFLGDIYTAAGNIDQK
jgi:hypothetical protein